MTLPDTDFWRGRRVLVTGHTGFKGSWLALWLARMGARVTGYARAPEHSLGIFQAAGVARQMASVVGDVRDSLTFRQCIGLVRPDIVFHMAAQSLVHRARRDPVETYEANIIGTAKVLQEIAYTRSVRAAVVITSDKVYDTYNDSETFREDARLGGSEPHGVSKAAAELVVHAFRESLPDDRGLGVATARAGNVIGGGDWAEDRLLPDAMDAFSTGQPLVVRNPDSTRPWQYVLDPLCGYLLLGERLIKESDDLTWRGAWNFGLDAGEAMEVRDVANKLVSLWNIQGPPAHTPMASWESVGETEAPYEASYRGVDSAKARNILGWTPRFTLDQSLEATVAWYKAQQRGDDMAGVSNDSIDAYANAR